VEPRGFEPLTSAVQSQIHNVVVVRCCLRMPAKSCIFLWEHPCSFAAVRVGWCTTGVNGSLLKSGAFNFKRIAGTCPLMQPAIVAAYTLGSMGLQDLECCPTRVARRARIVEDYLTFGI